VWCYVIVVSDRVIKCAKGQAGLGAEGVIEAAQRSERATAADTIREIHRAVLAACAGRAHGRRHGHMPVRAVTSCMAGSAQQPRGRVEHRLTLVDALHTPRINAARSSPYAGLLPEHWALLRVALSDTGLGTGGRLVSSQALVATA
jgi:hypothetical protein